MSYMHSHIKSSVTNNIAAKQGLPSILLSYYYIPLLPIPLKYLFIFFDFYR